MSEAVIKSKVTADTSQFEAGVKKAGATAESFKGAMKSVGADIKQAFAVGGVVAFAQAMGGVISEAKAAMDIFGSVADTAMELGISPESVQALQAFAEDSGLAGDAFTGMIAKVRAYQDAIKAGGEESEKAQLSLAGLGIAAEEFSQMKPGDAFVALSEALAKYEGDGARAEKVFDILGAKGRKMQERITDLGKQGGLDALVSKYAAAGQIMDADTVARIDKAGDEEAGRRRAARIREVQAGLIASEAGGSSQVAADFEQGMKGGIIAGGARGVMQGAIESVRFMSSPISYMSEQFRGIAERIKGTDTKNLEGLSQKQIEALQAIQKNTAGGAKL